MLTIFDYWSIDLKLFVVYLYTIGGSGPKNNSKIKKKVFLGQPIVHYGFLSYKKEVEVLPYLPDIVSTQPDTLA